MFKGFQGFFVVWLGQFVSLLGTSMTRFALTIWVYGETESATALALVGFFSFAPVVLMGPFAGALVDRWNRKLVMFMSDFGAAVSTAILLVLYSSGQLELWHLYLAGAVGGVFEAFQFPAFSAAVTLMVPKKHYARASAMQGLAQATTTILSALLGPMALVLVGLQGVMIIDLLTVVAAFAGLALTYVPQPTATKEGIEARGSIFKEARFGFSYIVQRRSLFGIQMIFFTQNLFGTGAFVLLPALVLASTNNDETALGLVQAASGLGGVVGGVIISAWGGPKRRIHAVLGGMILSNVMGTMLFGVGQTLSLWMMGGFFTLFFIPLLNGGNQAIWQAKIPPDIQGKVFSARALIAQITAPIGMLIFPPVVDNVLTPAMMPGGALQPLFGWLVGSGPGAGLSLMFIILGMFGLIFASLGYVIPFVRDIEDLIPDHDMIDGPDTAPDAILTEELIHDKPKGEALDPAPNTI